MSAEQSPWPRNSSSAITNGQRSSHCCRPINLVPSGVRDLMDAELDAAKASPLVLSATWSVAASS